jgi:hypothetical protein
MGLQRSLTMIQVLYMDTIELLMSCSRSVRHNTLVAYLTACKVQYFLKILATLSRLPSSLQSTWLLC